MQELDVLHQHLKSKLADAPATSATATSSHTASRHHGNIHDGTKRRLSDSEQIGLHTGFESQNGGRHVNFEGKLLHEIDSGDTHLHSDIGCTGERRRARTLSEERTYSEAEHEFHPNGVREFSDKLDTDRNIHTDEDDDNEIFSGRASPHYRHGDLRHLEDRGEGEEDSHNDEEEEDGCRDDMVFVRPLNDVSSAAFSNGINNDVISPPFSSDAGPPDEESASSTHPDDKHVPPRDYHRSLHQRDRDGEPLVAEGALGFQADVMEEYPSSFRRREIDAGYLGDHSQGGPIREHTERSEHERLHSQEIDSLDVRHDRTETGYQKFGDADLNVEGILDEGSPLESNFTSDRASSGRSHLLTGHPSQSRPGEDDKFGLPHNVGEIPEESTGGTSARKGKTHQLGSENALKAASQSDSNSAHATHGSNDEDRFDVSVSSISGVRSGIENNGGSGGIRDDDDYVEDGGDAHRSGMEDDDDYIEDGIVLTLDAREAELQRQQLELEEAERAAMADAAVRRKMYPLS